LSKPFHLCEIDQPVGQSGDALQQTQPVLPNSYIGVHHEDLVEECVDRSHHWEKRFEEFIE